MKKFIITIDGRVCSGKTSLIKNLNDVLSLKCGYKVPHFSCGEYYRRVLQNNIPNEHVDDEIVKYLSHIYNNYDVAIVDGRSSGFALKDEIQTSTDKAIISILLDVNKIEQKNRILLRENCNFRENMAEALERDRRDVKRCFRRYNKNIFDKQNYDIYLDTSFSSIEENTDNLISAIDKKFGILNTPKTLLFSEETETTLSNELLKRKDILPVYLRFSDNFNFSDDYLQKTKDCLSFVVNDSLPVELEAQRFQNWISEKGISVQYFCNDSEFLQEKAHRFARALSLPSLSQEQVLWVRDKVKMKEKLRELGLSVMDFQPINSLSDISEFAEKQGFPVMFKRRKGFSSIDAYKISSADDIRNLPVNIKPEKFMVEKFNTDPEWIIDALVQDNKVLDTFISCVPVSPIWAVVENKINTHITTPDKPQHFDFQPQDLMQRVVNGMNLKNGYIHMELFISDKGKPTICEFGWRMAGCKIPEDHSIAYGFDIYDTFLDIMTGRKAKLKYSKNKKYVGDLYLPNKPGIISSITPLEELLKYEGAIGGKMFVKKGTFVKPRRAGNEASGYIFVEGNSIDDVKRKMFKILNNFNIQTNNSIINNLQKGIND